ncbi:MAG: RNA methyltransferase [Ruminococcaceae bacterium]|nr:RNA methyltransferase [Oscillospiraceae bacterium]
MEIRPEIIRSRQNRTVVEVAKLTDRKAREATKSFRFDGIKLLWEAMKNRLPLETILLKESNGEALLRELMAEFGEVAAALCGRVLTLSDEVFDKISEEKSPEGVICVAKYIDKLQKIVTIYNDGNFLTDAEERIVLLESVRDPTNVGAIVRSAAAIGIDRLILSADCADIYHPRAVRASMGTLFNQRIDRVSDLSAAIRALRASGRRVFAAALDEEAWRLGDFARRGGDCVVIGNEGHGLSAEVLEACDRAVYIPMSGRAESFNAAVAASILMWEFSK